MGLRGDTYEAFCLDEAVIYFGLALEAELEEAGVTPTKEDRKIMAARQRVLDRVLGKDEVKGSGYADPALMFK